MTDTSATTEGLPEVGEPAALPVTVASEQFEDGGQQFTLTYGRCSLTLKVSGLPEDAPEEEEERVADEANMLLAIAPAGFLAAQQRLLDALEAGEET